MNDKDCMVVTVEFHSKGDAKQSSTLCRLKFWNDGPSANGVGSDYSFEMSRWAPNMSKVWKRGVVKSFDRVTRGPWDLIYCALADAAGNRNAHAPLPQERFAL